MELTGITKEDFFDHLAGQRKPWHKAYLAMYSSQWHGFVTDPDLMMVPMDDHLVHRGDGVFDVMRCFAGKIYQMEAHLGRLGRSARAISLTPPPDYEQIREIIKTLVLEGGEKDCVIRVFLSRGPGSFSTNPYDCPSAQLYIVVMRFKGLSNECYQRGIPIVTSAIPIKKSFFATIKSCNYLPNVLMKMEAIGKGCEYSIAMDEEGYLAEGSTENIAILGRDGVLRFPGFETTLAGITISRILELSEVIKKEGIIHGVKFAKIAPEEAYRASEIMLTGTSMGVVPVVTFDGHAIGTGHPGPVYLRLHSLLREDMMENHALLTEIPWE